MRRRMVLQGLVGTMATVVARPQPALAADQGGRLDAVVVGAGIAGLTAGCHLIDRPIAVIEANGRAGGRTMAGHHEGWTFALGTGYLGRPDRVLAGLLGESGLHAEEIPAPLVVRLHQGRSYRGSAGQARLLIEQGGLPAFNRFITELTKLADDYEEVPDHEIEGKLGRYDGISCRAWFRELKLPAIYDQTFNVAARGRFGANLDEISALSALPELAFDFAGTSTVTNLDELGTWEQEHERTGAFSFRNGIAAITDALAQRLGPRLRLNTTVTGIERLGHEGWRVTARHADGAVTSLETRTVVLAVPAPQALRLAAGVLSPEIATRLGEIRYARLAMVALFSEISLFDHGFDLALPDGGLITDLYDATWMQRHSDPEARRFRGAVAVACCAAPGYRDQSLGRLSDRELLARIGTELEAVLPGAGGRIAGSQVQRFEYAYPVMVPGAYQRLIHVHEEMTGTLQLAGDSVIYPTFEAAAASGALAARRVRRRLI